MTLVVEPSGVVALDRRAVPIKEDHVPSRRDVEAAFIALRAKHGLTSRREIDVLWKAFYRVVPTHPTTEEL